MVIKGNRYDEVRFGFGKDKVKVKDIKLRMVILSFLLFFLCCSTTTATSFTCLYYLVAVCFTALVSLSSFTFFLSRGLVSLLSTRGLVLRPLCHLTFQAQVTR